MSSVMQANFKIVIPARYASTRLPGKPLIDIHGKPMIEWVYQAAVQSHAQQVVVATDDERISKVVESFGGDCCLTRSDHTTGSDRIVEVCETLDWSDETIIVNLQGDEPLMPAQNLSQVALNLQRSGYDMATLHKSIDQQSAQNPNQVKLVHDQQGKALYFSRAAIPFQRDEPIAQYYGHIGLYAYRVGFLKTYATLLPCMLEQSEKLEQLRALYYGYSIHTELAALTPGIGVDTREDLLQVSEILKGHAT
jgi:3-deoxy-manno-octulosonate cytidylyltransferase (CMP-KDO synthetase)